MNWVLTPSNILRIFSLGHILTQERQALIDFDFHMSRVQCLEVLRKENNLPEVACGRWTWKDSRAAVASCLMTHVSEVNRRASAQQKLLRSPNLRLGPELSGLGGNVFQVS